MMNDEIIAFQGFFSKPFLLTFDCFMTFDVYLLMFNLR